MNWNTPPDIAIQAATRSLLTALDPSWADAEGLTRTPDRVARFYQEFLHPPPFDLTTFDAQGADEMVVVSAIPFYSLCEHHLLPFFGTAAVGYVPAGRLVGLSKLPRLVHAHARALQNQERLGMQVADHLMSALVPKGVGVIVTARHLCMEMRGIRAVGAHTTTCALRGCFLNDGRTRREFLDLDRNSRR